MYTTKLFILNCYFILNTKTKSAREDNYNYYNIYLYEFRVLFALFPGI